MKISVLKLYYLLLFFLSCGVVFSFLVFNGIRLYLYDLPVLLIAPISIMYLWNIRKKMVRVKYFLLFLAIGLTGLFFYLSTLSELLVASAYLFRLVLYSLLFVPILFFSKKSIEKLLKGIVVSGLIFLCLGYFQYFFYNDLANLYYLGWDRHLYRFFSSFLDPNFAGIYLVFLFILSLSFSWGMKLKWRRRLIFLVVAVYMPAILLTYSRTAYISLIVSMCTFLFFVNKKLLLLFVVFFIILLILLPKNFGGEGVNLFRVNSIFARLEAGEAAYTIFIKNPIIGIGFNAYKYAQLREGVLQPTQLSSHAASGVPNSYLFALATTGIVGFSFLAIFITGLLKSLLKVSKEEVQAYTLSRAVFAVIVGLLATSFFENALFYSPVVILLVISIALTERLKK